MALAAVGVKLPGDEMPMLGAWDVELPPCCWVWPLLGFRFPLQLGAVGSLMEEVQGSEFSMQIRACED